MNVLFVGAHPDDIEHGSGALFCKLLKLKNKYFNVKYLSFSKCTDIPRNIGIVDEIEIVKNYIITNNGEVTMLDLPNRKLPEYALEIREQLEVARDTFKPDMVITHWKDDIHQDHKTVADECFRVFRTKTILCYECIRSCPQFVPDFYITMTKEDIVSKLNLLYLYETQKSLYYNQEHVLWSLARLRGAEINKEFAEGYFTVRIISNILGEV